MAALSSEVQMSAWQLSSDRATGKTPFGPRGLLQNLDERVTRYLDEADHGRLLYPACKRSSSDAESDLRSVWDHTRLEAMRYVTMVPRREYTFLAEPAWQPEMLDVYLRQQAHEDTVIEFTGSAMNDLAIAIVAGFNWLNHCAALAEADPRKFSRTLGGFRKVVVLAQQWWAMEGSEARCSQMLTERDEPPLLLYLTWAEYTRLAKEVASAACLGRRGIAAAAVGEHPTKPGAASSELTKILADLEKARDPESLAG
jgi:hypothetical protein